MRDDWVRLATNEYVAVTALEAQLGGPAYGEGKSLSVTIAESAANVIYGARLADRPDSFRHDRALRQQK